MYKHYLVFDVESVGLHGEGFAVGYVVVDSEGQTLEEGLFGCHAEYAKGTPENYKWVLANVQSPVNMSTPKGVRHAFWKVWERWKEEKTAMVADCAWPVEARFLIDSVNDDLEAREWGGPYPLHDLASVLMMLGKDPLAVTERLPNELPAHNPLNDARQSARQLMEALRAPL